MVGVDTAKDAIYSRLHDTQDGTRPYWALEVFGGGPGTLSPDAFTRSGDVLGLDGVKQLKSAFKSYPSDGTGSIATLKDFGEGSGLTPGVSYRLYRYDRLDAVPDSRFNAHAPSASATWPIRLVSGTTFTLSQKIRSDQTVVYRAVRASAP